MPQASFAFSRKRGASQHLRSQSWCIEDVAMQNDMALVVASIFKERHVQGVLKSEENP